MITTGSIATLLSGLRKTAKMAADFAAGFSRSCCRLAENGSSQNSAGVSNVDIRVRFIDRPPMAFIYDATNQSALPRGQAASVRPQALPTTLVIEVHRKTIDLGCDTAGTSPPSQPLLSLRYTAQPLILVARRRGQVLLPDHYLDWCLPHDQ